MDHALATRNEIETLARRALALLEGHAWRSIDNFGATIEQLRFCMSAAADLGDPGLLYLVPRAREIFEVAKDRYATHEEVTAAAVDALVRQLKEVDATVEALAKHPAEAVRLSVASSLPRRCLGRDAILEVLAADASLHVRTAARVMLAPKLIPWWALLFERDPAAELGAAESARLLPMFNKLLALVEVEPPVDAKAIAALAKKLPDALAVALAKRLLLRGFQVQAPLVTMLLRAPEGVDALLETLPKWASDPYAPEAFTAALAEGMAKSRARADVCAKLAVAVLEASAAARDGGNGWPARTAPAVTAAWPKTSPPRALLDRVLDRSRDPDVDNTRLDILGLFTGRSRRRGEAALAREVLAFRIAGGTGPLRVYLMAFDSLLKRLPKRELCEGAKRALASSHEGDLAWALALLTGALYDPKVDGPRARFVERLEEEPRFRRPLARASTNVALPWLRRRLRGGELDFESAFDIVRATKNLWGTSNEESRAPSRRQERRPFSDVLGPRALRGPTTALEWERLREARSSAVRDRSFWRMALKAMPPGLRTATDEALFEEAMNAARDGRHFLVGDLAGALSISPIPGDERRIDVLVALDADDSFEVEAHQRRIHAKLGLALVDDTDEDAESAGAPPEATEWMDRDDE